jgi:hypothetical protein
MTVLDTLVAYFKQEPLLANADPWRGQWSDNTGNTSKYLIAIAHDGGGGNTVTRNIGNVEVMFLTPQNGKQYADDLEQAVTNIVTRMRTQYKACGIAQIKLLGGIIGPGYTAELRAWFRLNIEIIT